MWFFTGISTRACLWLLASLLGLGCGQDVSRDYRRNHVATSTPAEPTFLTYVRSPRATSLTQRSCLAPPQPENGQWRLRADFCEDNSANCRIPEGTELGVGYQLIYSCNAGYEIEGNSVVLCGAQGDWFFIPVCREIRCEPLNTVSRSGHCSRFGESVNCTLPVLPRTRAEVSCLPGYRKDLTILSPKRNILDCEDDGQWKPEPIRCVPVCGQAVTHQRPFIIDGFNASIGDFPWHATLYRETRSQKETKKEFKCGGTIIQANLVMTAAHCIYDESKQAEEGVDRYFVMTGNSYRDYDHPEHNPDIVKRAAVKRIHIYFSFRSLRGHYGSDIALLELEKPFVFSEILLPACLDPSGYNAPYLETGKFGKLAGFGITATGESSETLQTLTVPYISYDNCKGSKNADKNDIYITKDKFCAGYTTTGMAVCEGDSGGGLVFLNNGKWYVMGIVSVGLGVDLNNGARTCERYAYTLYTRVSEFTDWILEVISKIEPRRQRPALNPNFIRQSFVTMTPKLTAPTVTTPRTTTSAVTPAIMPQAGRSSGCSAPSQPDNGEWKIYPAHCSLIGDADLDCKVRPNVKLGTGSRLVYSCNAGYRLRGNSDVYCDREENWVTLPECVEIRCSPFNNLTTMATCQSQTGGLVACDVPVLPKTEANLECRAGYTEENFRFTLQADRVKCNEDGNWEPDPITCALACGRMMPRQQPLVVNGAVANIHDFPWHATLYQRSKRSGEVKMDIVCGATIITPNLLLTAAHCIYDETIEAKMNPDNLFIAAGNIFGEYDSPLHNPLIVQKRAVKNAYISCQYYGLRGNYASDIALLELKEPLLLSEQISPACLDFAGHSTQILDSGALGKISGFGRTATGSTSSVLQTITVPYVTYKQCKNDVGNNEVFISNDKFCAGRINGSAICEGDTGGGLVFKKSDLWYVLGIASVRLGVDLDNGESTCNTRIPTLYTRVSNYMGWIRSVAFQLERYKKYASC